MLLAASSCLVAEALTLIRLTRVCTMHAGTAGDFANRAVAKQLLAPPDWGRLAVPLIWVAHTIVDTTFSVINGAVHGCLDLCLVSRTMHSCHLCFLPSETLGSLYMVVVCLLLSLQGEKRRRAQAALSSSIVL